MKKFPKILASSVMALSLLAGCGSEGGNAAAAVELNEGDTVKVGLNYELSGATATYGLAMEKGSQLAIKQFTATAATTMRRAWQRASSRSSNHWAERSSLRKTTFREIRTSMRSSPL